jgi:hypothetical protein
MHEAINQAGWYSLLRPIAEAPVQSGVRFGPCLLTNDKDVWMIGAWNGEVWLDCGTFEVVTPILWALLPSPSLPAQIPAAPA